MRVLVQTQSCGGFLLATVHHFFITCGVWFAVIGVAEDHSIIYSGPALCVAWLYSASSCYNSVEWLSWFREVRGNIDLYA